MPAVSELRRDAVLDLGWGLDRRDLDRALGPRQQPGGHDLLGRRFRVGFEQIDLEFEGLMRKLVTYMIEDPRTISSSIDLVFVAKAIERVGDHGKNLAEAVIYVVKGTDVRHNPVESVEAMVR